MPFSFLKKSQFDEEKSLSRSHPGFEFPDGNYLKKFMKRNTKIEFSNPLYFQLPTGWRSQVPEKR
jgi:hypothetical protein